MERERLTSEGRRRVSTRRKSEILSLQWPYIVLPLSRGIREMDFAISETASLAAFLAAD